MGGGNKLVTYSELVISHIDELIALKHQRTQDADNASEISILVWLYMAFSVVPENRGANIPAELQAFTYLVECSPEDFETIDLNSLREIKNKLLEYDDEDLINAFFKYEKHHFGQQQNSSLQTPSKLPGQASVFSTPATSAIAKKGGNPFITPAKQPIPPTPIKFKKTPNTSDLKNKIRDKQLTLTDLVIYYLDGLYEMQHSPSPEWDSEWAEKARDRLWILLSNKRDERYRSKLAHSLVEEREKLEFKERWASFVFGISLEVEPFEDRNNLQSLMTKKANEAKNLFREGQEAHKPGIKKTELDIEVEKFDEQFRNKLDNNREKLCADLAGKSESDLKNYQRTAEEDYIAAQLESIIPQEKYGLYEAELQDSSAQINRATPVVKGIRRDPILSNDVVSVENLAEQRRPNALGVIELTEKNEETILYKALKLADKGLVDTIWLYAEHLDTDTIDKKPNSLDTRQTLLRKTLTNMVDDYTGQIIDPEAFLFLASVGGFKDQNLMKAVLKQTARSNKLFTTQHQLSPEIIQREMQEATTACLADLIIGAHEEFYQLYVAPELEKRFQLKDKSTLALPNTQDVDIILDALKKRAAETEYFEEVTKTFAVALHNIFCGYKKTQGNSEKQKIYSAKLNKVYNSLEPNKNGGKTARDIAQELINETDVETNPLYKKVNSSHYTINRTQQPKTIEIIEKIANPRRHFSWFSSKSEKSNSLPTKLEMSELIKKGQYNEEARKRALYIEHVFKKSIKHLRTRSGKALDAKYEKFKEVTEQFILKKITVEQFFEQCQASKTPDNSGIRTLHDTLSEPKSKLLGKIWKTRSTGKLEREFKAGKAAFEAAFASTVSRGL